ncbi:MAG: spore maturation protein CgeB [Verrucomicrobiota bacterium]|jgi:glycosyltransferase involved in cell wall biosynthesis
MNGQRQTTENPALCGHKQQGAALCSHGSPRPECPASGARELRFFYIGQLAVGSTNLDRMQGLRSLGVQIEPFNTSDYYQFSNRLTGSLACRFHLGPTIRRFNEAVLRAAERLPAVTHVWVDKGVWLWPETLDALRDLTGARLVHYTPDPQITYHRSRFFLRGIPKYDVLFTTKRFELELYKKAGARRVVLVGQGFDPGRFQPRPSEPAYESDVLFVGHAERHYAGRIKAAYRSGAALKVWGPGWRRYTRVAPWAKACVQGEGLWGEPYPQALCSTKIALGFLSKLIPETVTTRSVEIPACGAFLLAERTDDHQSLFEEGREAEYFSSDDELADKMRFYLANPAVRERIAAAGRQRCLKSGYRNADRLGQMLEHVLVSP